MNRKRIAPGFRIQIAPRELFDAKRGTLQFDIYGKDYNIDDLSSRIALNRNLPAFVVVEVVQVHDPEDVIIKGDEQTEVLYYVQKAVTSVVLGREGLPVARFHSTNRTPAWPGVRLAVPTRKLYPTGGAESAADHRSVLLTESLLTRRPRAI